MDTREKQNDASAPKKRRMKKQYKVAIVFGALMVTFVALCTGFFVWHEQPGFCSTICHVPMAPYVEGYASEDPSLLVSTHADKEVTCLECHGSNIGDQLKEGMSWLSGGYDLPLKKRKFDDSMCLNGSCHDVSVENLAQSTEHLKYNPHSDYHKEGLSCNSCHSMHGESTNACASCHSDATKLP
ncbi:MAG TPA: hypothetical protein DEB24_02400 [Coriobacteriia bacterium]|nr:hypothetical protein [Coriobacteriia bacterium]